MSNQEKPPKSPSPRVSAAAKALGRLGGLKGGPARARKLTKEQRTEIARKAGRARMASLTETERKRLSQKAVKARSGKKK